MRKYGVVIFLFLLTLTTFSTAFAGTWTPLGYISSIHEYFVNNPRVYGLDISSNPASCTNLSEGAGMIKSFQTEAQAKTATAYLLSAFLSGKRVSIKLSDSECDPVGRPTFYAIRVEE